MGPNAEPGGEAKRPHATPAKTRPTCCWESPSQRWITSQAGNVLSSQVTRSQIEHPRGESVGTPVPGRHGVVGTHSRVPSRARPLKVMALGGSSGRALSNETFTGELKLKPLKNRSALLSLRALHHSIFTLVLPQAPAAKLSLPSSNLFLLTLKLRLRSAGETPRIPPAGGRTAPARQADAEDQTPLGQPGPARCKLARVGHAGKPLRGKEPWLEKPGSPRGPAGPWSRPLSHHPGSPWRGPLGCPNTVGAAALAPARCFQDGAQPPRHVPGVNH